MNERAEHTAGPWHVGGEWPQIVAVYDHNSIYIAHAVTGVGSDWIGANPIGIERAKANARLIAAAPDLLRVAELLVDWLDEEPGAHALCDAARVAIARATGEA